MIFHTLEAQSSWNDPVLSAIFQEVEQLNQELGYHLRTYYSRKQQWWSKFLSLVEYAQNSLTHFSKLMPFQRVLGYQPLDPMSEEPSDIPTVDDCGKAPMCTSNRQFAINAYRPTTGDVHRRCPGTNQDSTRSDPIPTPPIEVDRSPAYLVELIIVSQQRRGHLQYLIDWKRYSPEEQ